MKYIVKRRISSGSFGTIFEVQSEDDGKIYALKELTNIDTLTRQRFEREITAIRSIEFISDYRNIGMGQGGHREDHMYYSRGAGI